MKYKVGDKVRIIENQSAHEFEIGEIVEIVLADDSTIPYKCFNGKKSWWVGEEDIASLDYTWEDFLKAPIGTKVTFESGEALYKTNEYNDQFTDNDFYRSYKDLKGFKDNIGNKLLGKIIKIEEPTYTIVYEPKEETTMPEIEEMKRLTDELCKTCDEFIKKIKESK